jgi:hypothetical protein
VERVPVAISLPASLSGRRGRPLRDWPLWGAIGIVLLAVLFAAWKAVSSRDDWLAANGATLLGATAGAAALFFIAAGAFAQARQAQSTELLSAFELARPDLEDLSRRIAVNARLVVSEYRDGRPGKLAKRELEYVAGDRTSFARLFAHGGRIASSLGAKSKLALDTKRNLQRQVRLYIQIFERVLDLAPGDELRGFVLELPLGRAYCALKVAASEDESGDLLAFLTSIDPAPDPEVDVETAEPR